MNPQLLDRISSIAYSFRDTVINTYELSLHVLKNDIPGAFVECGVAAGAQIMSMQAAMVDVGKSREIVAYDSFEGIPLAGPMDAEQPGKHSIDHDVNAPLEQRLISSGVTAHTMESVVDNFKNAHLPLDNLQFVKGWFQNTVPVHARTIGQIALLRLDGDLYESTMVCLEHLFPLVVEDGVIIVDDYGLPGARKAVHEYAERVGAIIEPEKVAPAENGVVWFFKKMSESGLKRIEDAEIEKAKQRIVPPAKKPGHYSQNNEQQIIIGYFNDLIMGGGSVYRTLLDIGANDGETYSNSRAILAEGANNGWSGVLLEPSPKAFERLKKLYENDDHVVLFPFGIADKDGEVEFWESGGYMDEPNVALVSCIDPKEKDRWGDTVKFEPIRAQMKTFSSFIKHSRITKFDFISIDAEGMDMIILEQINMNEVGCKCFCIEHNGVQYAIDAARAYAKMYEFKEIGFNGENLIFGK